MCVNKPFSMGASGVNPGANMIYGKDNSLVLNSELDTVLGTFLDSTLIDKDYMERHPIARLDNMVSFGPNIEAAENLFTQQTQELSAEIHEKIQEV